MWSCGVIVYILLGGYPPFHDDNHAILYRKIKAADYAFDPQYWDQVSDDAKDLIKKMLVVDPDKRSISASRGAAAPSRHRCDSCPSDEVDVAHRPRRPSAPAASGGPRPGNWPTKPRP